MRPIEAWAIAAGMGVIACSGRGGDTDPGAGTDVRTRVGAGTGVGTGAGVGSPAGATADAGVLDARARDAGPGTDASPTTDAGLAAPRHARCGWLGADDTAGYAAFAANADYYDAVHPDWYALGADGVSLRAMTGADDPTVLSAAQARGVQLIPMIDGAESGDEVLLRAMMSDPTKRAAHVQALVALATSKRYAGLDLDYEHLWQAGDRPLFTQLVTETAAAMHAVGKQLSIPVPALADGADTNAWDYGALAPLLDTVHVMGYDYHSIGTHAGPTAPLGWIDAVGAHAASTGYASKFVLGVPNYGVTPSWYCALADCPAACTGPLATSTTHMDGNNCSYNVDTHYTAGRSLNCDSANGALFFDDTASLEEKVQTAKAHGLGGITYWTIGSEPPGFLAMVQSYY